MQTEIIKLPPFSIITITKNHKHGLKKTASSIQTQTCKNYEWIIVDGDSTDGTQNDFIDYKNALIISEPDKGIYDAMNKGIDKTTGDYIIFMNAGDQFASPDVLQQILIATANNPDFIYGDSLEDHHYKRARSHTKMNWGMFTHHQAMIYKRASLDTLRYNLDYKIAADYDLTLRFLRLAKNIVYIPLPVCIFETGGTSQTSAGRGRNEQFITRHKNKICSILLNHYIWGFQLIAYCIRSKFESLYWVIKKNLFK